jgi:carboxymethylenebutenolidase
MICERCVQGGVLDGDFTGRMVDGAYLASAPGEGTLSSGTKTAIVLLTDIFGLSLKNCKILADSLAQKLGVDVWIPDMFDGLLACILSSHIYLTVLYQASLLQRVTN